MVNKTLLEDVHRILKRNGFYYRKTKSAPPKEVGIQELAYDINTYINKVISEITLEASVYEQLADMFRQKYALKSFHRIADILYFFPPYSLTTSEVKQEDYDAWFQTTPFLSHNTLELTKAINIIRDEVLGELERRKEVAINYKVFDHKALLENFIVNEYHKAFPVVRSNIEEFLLFKHYAYETLKNKYGGKVAFSGVGGVNTNLFYMWVLSNAIYGKYTKSLIDLDGVLVKNFNLNKDSYKLDPLKDKAFYKLEIFKVEDTLKKNILETLKEDNSVVFILVDTDSYDLSNLFRLLPKVGLYSKAESLKNYIKKLLSTDLDFGYSPFKINQAYINTSINNIQELMIRRSLEGALVIGYMSPSKYNIGFYLDNGVDFIEITIQKDKFHINPKLSGADISTGGHEDLIFETYNIIDPINFMSSFIYLSLLLDRMIAFKNPKFLEDYPEYAKEDESLSKKFSFNINLNAGSDYLRRLTQAEYISLPRNTDWMSDYCKNIKIRSSGFEENVKQTLVENLESLLEKFEPESKEISKVFSALRTFDGDNITDLYKVVKFLVDGDLTLEGIYAFYKQNMLIDDENFEKLTSDEYLNLFYRKKSPVFFEDLTPRSNNEVLQLSAFYNNTILLQ